jgi:hypothetical protein
MKVTFNDVQQLQQRNQELLQLLHAQEMDDQARQLQREHLAKLEVGVCCFLFFICLSLFFLTFDPSSSAFIFLSHTHTLQTADR